MAAAKALGTQPFAGFEYEQNKQKYVDWIDVEGEFPPRVMSSRLLSSSSPKTGEKDDESGPVLLVLEIAELISELNASAQIDHTPECENLNDRDNAA